MKCPDHFEQDIFLFGFQFDPVPKSENKELFYILFESEQKRNKFFKQSVWLQDVKHASVWLQVEHASRKIVIQKVFVDLSKICILQYNELKYYPSTFTYRKLTWNPNIIEEFSSARSLSYIDDFLLSRPRPKKCNSKHSWKICMDHIAVMELLAIIAEKNPFTYYEQYLFHLSISHIQKCHSNISKIALVAIFMNFPGVNNWRNENERKNDYLEAYKLLEWLYNQKHWNQGAFLAYHLLEMAPHLVRIEKIFEARKMLKRADDIFFNLDNKTEHEERMEKSCILFSAWIDREYGSPSCQNLSWRSITNRDAKIPVVVFGKIKQILNERDMVVNHFEELNPFTDYEEKSEDMKVDLDSVNVYFSKNQERLQSLLDIGHTQRLITITFVPSCADHPSSTLKIESIHILEDLEEPPESMVKLEAPKDFSIISEDEYASSEEEQFLSKVSNIKIVDIDDDPEN